MYSCQWKKHIYVIVYRYINQLQQSIHLCHKRKMSRIWQVNTLWQSQVKGSLRCTPTSSNQCSYQASTFYTLFNQRYNPKKILKLMVTMTRSNQGHSMTLHTYTPTNVPTKHQLPTFYGFQDIAQTRFYRSRSIQQGQRSNQGHTTTLHTYTP